VGSDYYRSGFIAGGLISILLGGQANIGTVESGGLKGRLRGFLEAISQNHRNIHVVESIKVPDDLIQTYNSTKILVEKHPGIKAIFVETVTVYGVCRALMELGLDKKIKVICFDETPITKQMLAEGRINAILYQNPFWQGYRSLEILLDYLINRRMPEHELNYSLTEIRIKESIIQNPANEERDNNCSYGIASANTALSDVVSGKA
jgi:LacI family transcriptional regulator